jgi:hypothetical protein
VKDWYAKLGVGLFGVIDYWWNVFFSKKIAGEWWELEGPPHDIESPAQIVKIL